MRALMVPDLGRGVYVSLPPKRKLMGKPTEFHPDPLERILQASTGLAWSTPNSASTGFETVGLVGELVAEGVGAGFTELLNFTWTRTCPWSDLIELGEVTARTTAPLAIFLISRQAASARLLASDISTALARGACKPVQVANEITEVWFLIQEATKIF